MIINHPVLGPRDAQEFVYLGDAALINRPDGLATDTPHPTATAYRFDRFRKGLMIDEKGQGAQPNLH